MTKALKRYGLLAVLTLMVAFGQVFVGALLPGNDPVSAGAPTCTWTGGGGNTSFSTAGNWTCQAGTVPVDGTTIIFPVNLTNRTGVNDLSSSITFSGIQFSGSCSGGYGASSYTLTGTFYLSGLISDTSTSNCLANTSIATLSLRGNSGYTVGNSSAITVNNLAMTTFTYAIDGTGVSNAQANLLNGLGTSLTGSGTISVASAQLNIFSGTTTSNFSGTVSLTNSQLVANKYDTSTSTWALGTGTIVIGTGSGFQVSLPTALSTFSIANPIQVSGTAPIFAAGQGYNGNENARIGITFGTTQDDDINGLIGSYAAFRSQALSGKSFALTGPVTLSTNTTVISNGQTTFSGALSGSGRTSTSYVTTSTAGKYGTLVIAGSSNSLSTANASYAQTAVRTSTVTGTDCAATGSSSSSGIFVGNANKVIVNGTCLNVLLRYGGILGGSGTVGSITSQAGKIAPGNSPGVLNSGNVSLDSSSSLDIEIGGTTTGQYDQLNVTGTVSLGSATLNTSHYGGFIPALNDAFTIINNDSSDAVTGTFAGLAQGATFALDGVTYTISYTGGTGNDVVLTATTVPSAPVTAGVLARPVNIVLAAGVVIAGLGLLILRNRYLKSARKTVRVPARR